MKYIEDAYTSCPFYQKESKNRLVCEGIVDCATNVSVFSSGLELARYKSRYCRKEYGGCILCQALLSKYA